MHQIKCMPVWVGVPLLLFVMLLWHSGTIANAAEPSAPSNEVRNQFDFTVPMHGPYLINPGFESMTVCWITRVPCAAGIEYRPVGADAEYTRLWQKVYGQVDFSQDQHYFHLQGLKPGTRYEYRLLSASDPYFGYDQNAFIGRETYTFRTLDPATAKFKVLFTSDFHGAARLALDPMIENSHAGDADFYVYLGDNVEDNMNDARYYLTFGFLDDISRKYGTGKPSIFLRGNHDISGRESYQWGRYFPRQDGKTYFAFTQGQVLFIVLDSMWTHKSPVINQAYTEYREEQIAWLTQLKQTAAFKQAKFRVVLSHVGVPKIDPAASFMDPFAAVFNDNTPEGRIHVWLVGHEHHYMRIDALSTSTKVGALPKYVKTPPAVAPYTFVVGDLLETLVMEVEPDALNFTSYQWKDGTIKDAFSVSSTGAVTDKMAVKNFPFPVTETPAKPAGAR